LLASPKTTAVLPARLIMLSFFLHGRRGERGPSKFKDTSRWVVWWFGVFHTFKNSDAAGLECGCLMQGRPGF